MIDKDYYKTLQVDPSAEPEVIAGAYRRLALKYHPDTNKSVDSKQMVEINEAYEVLSDPAKRREYDGRRRRGQTVSQQTKPSAARSRQSAKPGQAPDYNSDFHHPTDGMEGYGDNSRFFCRDGYFHIAIQTSHKAWWQSKMFARCIGDFRMRVEAQLAVNAGRHSSCGMVFRYEERPESFYLFEYSRCGRYKLGVKHSSEYRELSSGWWENLQSDSRLNVLEVEAIGSRIELSANGHLLAAVQDSTLRREGWMGVCVVSRDHEHFAEARFRDFRLYRLSHLSQDYLASEDWYDPRVYDVYGEQAFSRCPACGRLLWHGYHVGFGPWIPQYCPFCGWETIFCSD